MKIARPKPHEPIRLVHVKAGPRYRVVLDIGETVDRKRRQVTRTFRTLGEARRFVLDTRAALAAGTFTAPNAATFDAVCDRWLVSKRDCREVTLLGYKSVLTSVRARLGPVRVQDIRRADVDGLIAWLSSDTGGHRGRGVGHRTIVLTLQTVRQVLAHAVDETLIAANPAAGVKAPRRQRVDARDVAMWTVADMLRFREVADQDEWAAGWRLTLSGLRHSEVLGLRWASVDLSAGLVRVEAGRVALDGHRTATDDPKSAASWRTVPVEAMHSGTVALLHSLSARQAADRLAGRDGVRRQQRLRPGGRARPADPARGVQRQIRAAVPHGQCARDPLARR